MASLSTNSSIGLYLVEGGNHIEGGGGTFHARDEVFVEKVFKLS